MSPILVAHVGTAFLGLLGGAVASYARKAGRSHRMSGIVFSICIMVTTAAGAYLAAMQPARLSVISALLTFYLVATGWATVARNEKTVGAFDIGASLVALSVAGAALTFAVEASKGPTGRLDGIPPLGYLIFGSVAALAAIADLKMISRRGFAGVQRITRHLWRMCAAFWIAAASFFLGQQKVMPASMHGSALLYAPELLILGLLIYWLFRVRRMKQFNDRAVVLASP